MVFQKGQSGNPAGRPKSEPTITPWLKRLLAAKRAGKTRAEHVAEQLVSMAEQGDINALKMVLERIDGKVLDQVDLTSGGEAFTFKIMSRMADRDAITTHEDR